MIHYEDSLTIEFQQAGETLHNLPQRPTNDELLLAYGLYKQSTIGNNKSQEPSLFNFKSHAKWRAWQEQAGKGRTRAKKEYIMFITQLGIKYLPEYKTIDSFIEEI